MPYRPPKPCAYLLCPDLVKDGSRYCDKHKGKMSKHSRKYDGRYKRGWPDLRAAYLRRHPLCVQCKKENNIRLATEVDHIVPIKVDSSKRLDWDNLQSMCKSCHSRKTASEQLRVSKQ